MTWADPTTPCEICAMTYSRQRRHYAGRYPRVNAEREKYEGAPKGDDPTPVKRHLRVLPPVTPEEEAAMDELAMRRRLRESMIDPEPS